MTGRAPPRLATWLLQKCGGADGLEHLIGDLVEQYQGDRSARWFWYQVCGALVLDLTRTLRTHAATFVGAVLAGSAFMAIGAQTLSMFLIPNPQEGGGMANATARGGVSHFLLLRTAQIATTLLVVATGWIVTRIHRSHQRLVVVVFALTATIPRAASLVVNGSAEDRMSALTGITLQVLITIIAGLWVIRPERLSAMQPRLRAAMLSVLLLATINATLRAANLTGLIIDEAVARYALVMLEIAGATYLALMLWRQRISGNTAA